MKLSSHARKLTIAVVIIGGLLSVTCCRAGEHSAGLLEEIKKGKKLRKVAPEAQKGAPLKKEIAKGAVLKKQAGAQLYGKDQLTVEFNALVTAYKASTESQRIKKEPGQINPFFDSLAGILDLVRRGRIDETSINMFEQFIARQPLSDADKASLIKAYSNYVERGIRGKAEISAAAAPGAPAAKVLSLQDKKKQLLTEIEKATQYLADHNKYTNVADFIKEVKAMADEMTRFLPRGATLDEETKRVFSLIAQLPAIVFVALADIPDNQKYEARVFLRTKPMPLLVNKELTRANIDATVEIMIAAMKGKAPAALPRLAPQPPVSRTIPTAKPIPGRAPQPVPVRGSTEATNPALLARVEAAGLNELLDIQDAALCKDYPAIEKRLEARIKELLGPVSPQPAPAPKTLLDKVNKAYNNLEALLDLQPEVTKYPELDKRVADRIQELLQR